MTSTLIHMIEPGCVVDWGGVRYRLIRHHNAPKGKVLFEVQNLERGGISMVTMTDTDRLDVLETP